MQVQQAQYRALILERVNVVISDWQAAWNADDSGALAKDYSEFGTLVLTGEKVTGREAIEDYLSETLPSIGHLSFSLAEFEASGSMAMMLSTFHFRESDGKSGERREVVGDCLTVLVEEGGGWKIRSQLFRPGPSP
jgi:uncharacterized protein (TIGR02246 family)